MSLVGSVSALVEQLRLACLHVPGLSAFAAAPYLFRPLLMVVLLGVVAGVVGVLVNLRCAEFSAEALVHAVFPGIVAGAVYGGIRYIIPTASAVAVVAALVLTLVSRRAARRSASEAGTAVVLTSFFSLGIILSLAKGDMSGQLEALMFGRLLEVTDERLAQALLVCLVALALVALTWRGQVAYAFDRTGALGLDLVLNMAVAAVVVSASTAVGTLMVIGYLVVPGATGRVLARRVRTMVLTAVVVGVGGGYLGMALMLAPSPRPVSPQASVTLCMCAVLLVAVASRRVRARWVGRRRAQVAAAGRRGAATQAAAQDTTQTATQAATQAASRAAAESRGERLGTDPVSAGVAS